MCTQFLKIHLSGWITLIIIQGFLFKDIKIQILLFCTFCAVLYTGQYVQLFIYPFCYSQQYDYLFIFFFVSNNPWKCRIISLLSFLIKWNTWERKCSQYFSYLNKKDMTFFQRTAGFRLYFLSLPNIINLFDISFLAKSTFLYH